MIVSINDLSQRLKSSLPHPHFTVIGDVHGKYDIYKNIISSSQYSVQVGDMVGRYPLPSKQYDQYESLKTVDSYRHKFIGGNHENYTVENGLFAYLPPHHLGNFGVWQIPDVDSNELSGKIFFVRGAWSIDGPNNPFNLKPSMLGVDYFKEEELTVKQFYDVCNLYEKVKPDFVITHTCPQDFQKNLNIMHNGITQKTLTGEWLNVLFEIHQPKIWVFGHYHQHKMMMYGSTLFVCLEQCVYHTLDNIIDGACLKFDKHLQLLFK